MRVKGLGNPATAIATVVVKGAEAIISAITRPRQDADWAGTGLYEEMFLRQMFYAFPTEKYAIIDTNAPLLVELYDFLVSYGKAQYPNKRGMVGAGDDMSEVARTYVQNFIRDCGGAQTFAFLFRDLEAEARCQARKNAVLAQIKQVQRANTIKTVAIVGVPILIVGGCGLAYWLYKRNRATINTKKND
jgi:hypothetical protein